MLEMAPEPERPLGALRARLRSSLLGRWWERLLEAEMIDRAVALAAKAFVSLFPAVVTVAALAPDRTRQNIAAALQRRVGLSGDSLDVVRESLDAGTGARASVTVVGFLLLLFYATSFTTALQRLYLRAWRRPPKAELVRYVTGLGWLVGLVVLLSGFGALRRIFVGTPGTVAFTLVSVTFTFLAWWATSYFMLSRQVRWRALVLPALLTAVGSATYGWAAAIWVPRSLLGNEAQFGFFGVSMTLMSWFVGLAFVIVVATTAGPVLVEDRGVIGRLARGPSDDVLRPGALAPLPPPMRDLGLRDALGRGTVEAPHGPPRTPTP